VVFLLRRDKIKNIQKSVAGQKQIYNVQAVQQARFLGILTIGMPVNLQVNSQNGAVEKIEKPWWSFLVGG